MVVIAYDIKDEKRLRKVAKFLEEMGIRAQRSVFEVDMGFVKAKKILKELQKLMNEDEDKCFLYEIKNKEDILASTSIERII